MTSWLRRQGYAVNRKRVRRLMRRLGRSSVAPKPCTSRPAPAPPDLSLPAAWARDRAAPSGLVHRHHLHPPGAWLRLPHGGHGLVQPLYTVLGGLGDHDRSVSCISALQSALRGHGRPEIFNSDQGAQFTSQAFTAVLNAAEVRISRDGKGRAMDNIMVERLWRTVKYEEIYLKEYRRVSDLIAALKAYFWFYNHERPHQSLAGATPVQVHRGAVQLAA